MIARQSHILLGCLTTLLLATAPVALCTGDPVSTDDLSCHVDETLVGGYTARDPSEAQEAAQQAWAVLTTANAPDVQAHAPGCDLANATITPTGACSQVVAGTNWRVQFDVSFANCNTHLAVQAAVFQPLPSSGGSPVVNDYVIHRKVPSEEVPMYGQCGGAGGNCTMMAEKMGMPAKDVCANADWPHMHCPANSVCWIWSKWYRQCVPSNDTLHCPADTKGLPGGFAPSHNTTEQQAVADAAWASLVKANATALPNDAGCDLAAAKATPLSACSQVVAGFNWVVQFKVTFPGSCPLYTVVDANVMQPLPGQGDMLVKATRVAPYDSASEYDQCQQLGGKQECQKMLVFHLWDQCGGTGDACTAAAQRLGQSATGGFCSDSRFPYSQCEYGTSCVRAHADFWQCN